MLIEICDKRADVENLVGEAKREDLGSVSLQTFQERCSFFRLEDSSTALTPHVVLS